MLEVLLTIFWFVVATSILVVAHELGHFCVARALGVRTLRFSIGFGNPIFSRRGKDGTEYWLSPFLLGGYVKFVDREDPAVAAGARPFLDEKVWKRMLIVIAGPLVNLVLAIVFLWLMFVVGVRELLPVMGPTSGAAAAAGIEEGDRIVAVEQRPVGTLVEALIALVDNSFGTDSVAVTVDRNGERRETRIALDDIPANREESKLFDYLGLKPAFRAQPAVVEKVTDGSAALAAGIRPGDRILAIDGVPATHDDSFRAALQKAAAAKAGLVSVRLERAGQVLELPATAEFSADPEGREAWRLGLAFEYDEARLVATYHYGAGQALAASLAEIRRVTVNSLHMLYRMLSGEASTKNLSGVVTIAQVTKSAAESGFSEFLRILGLVSLSLCILNLLPIPMLDGGQLLYYLIEAVKGSPLSERAQWAGQWVGLFAVFSLMGIALYNDLARLLVPQ
jgi:regulator of sigma E protease